MTLAALTFCGASASLAVQQVGPAGPGADRPGRALASADPSDLFASTRYVETAVWSTVPTNSLASPIQPVDVAMLDETHLFVADAGNRVVWSLDTTSGKREPMAFDLPDGDPCTVVPIAVSVQRTARRLLVLWTISDLGASLDETRTVLEVRTFSGALQRQVEVPDASDVSWQEGSDDVFLLKSPLVTRLRWPNLTETRTYPVGYGGSAGQLALTPRFIAAAYDGVVALTTLDVGRAAGTLNLGNHEAVSVAADPYGRLYVLVRPRTLPDVTPTPGPTAAPGLPADDGVLVMAFDANGAPLRTFGPADLNVPPVPKVSWPFVLDVFASTAAGSQAPARPAFALSSAEKRVGVYTVPPCDDGSCRRGAVALKGAVPPVPPASFSFHFDCGPDQDNRVIVAALPDGGLVAYGGLRGQIVRFGPDGRSAQVATAADRLLAMATDGKNTLFGILEQPGRVKRTLVARFELPADPEDPLEMTAVQDCDCDPGGSLAVGGQFVYVGRPPGKSMAILRDADLTSAGEIRQPEAVGLWPSSIATTPDGWVWAADLLAGQIHGWAPPGGQGNTRWGAAFTAGPWHLAGGSLGDGRALLAAHMTDGTIEMHDAASGNLLARWDPVTSGQRYALASLAVGRGGRVYLADDTNGVVRVFEPRLVPDPPPGELPIPSPTPSRRTCLVRGDKVAAPPVVVLGHAAQITLTLAADCPVEERESGADIVLVMDRSDSMAGKKLADAQAAAKSFAQFLDTRAHRVGLVAFNSSARVVTSLTTDTSAVIGGLNSLLAEGGTNIAAGLFAADDHLRRAARSDALPVIVLLSDGQSPIQPALAAAEAARGRGVRIYTIGLGPDVDHTLMLGVSSGRYFPAPSSAELFPIYREIVRLVTQNLSGNLLIDDQMAPDIRLVADSAVPKAVEGSDTLHWGSSILSPGGITLTYQVLPLRAGRLPTNRRAVAGYTDADGVSRSYTFPVPEIEVITPTPSNTVTSTPTPAPTRTSTPAPTSTAAPTARPVYLPLAIDEKCTPAQRRVDVALVLDASTSMAEPAGVGAPGSKLDAARVAARAFMDQLQLDAGDQAALITFNSDARLLQTLTNQPAAIDRAIGSITLGSLTRLQLGIEVATEELHSVRHRAANAKVIILVTDGRANPEPVSLAVDQAAAAKAAGILVFTIGLGSDVDREALAEMASLRSYYFEVLDTSTLTGIFVQIVGHIPCSPTQFWGGR